MSRLRSLSVPVALLAGTAGLAGCSSDGGSATTTGDGTATTKAAALAAAQLNGSGSTFQKVFVEASIEGFAKKQSAITINYGGGGSGKGRTDLQGGLVDYAGTDSLVKDEDKAKFKGEFVYVPTVSAPITVSYNVPGVDKLVLDADTTAKIFQRQIKKWDDPAVKALNPSATLPSLDIVVAHRSDGSGTTEQFTKYLVAAAPSTWTLKSGSTVEWPADTQAGNGNAGVADIVKSQSGAVGYVDLADANTKALKKASLKNASGETVEPTLAAVTKALEGVALNPDNTYNPLNSKSSGAYPIAAPTWVVVYKNQTDKAKGAALKSFLTFMLTDGQKLAEENDYAALPAVFVTAAKATVDAIVVPA